MLAVLFAAALFFQLCLTQREPVRHDASWQPEYVLVATAEDITINCQTRYSVLFNGTSPGPTLRLQEGKTTWVRVWNRIAHENVTVHWHGLTQRTAPFADGTPMVSQWPIAPDEFFDYEIRPEIGDAGSYFYHSHVGYQASTARGVLIVDEAEGAAKPYEYDDEIPLFFGDFHTMEDAEIIEGLKAAGAGWAAESDAILLNDRSGTTLLSNATADASCKPLIITVEPSKTYRLRLIAGTTMSLVMAGIEGHEDLTVIEADGHYTKPANTSYIQIGSGQRFSVLLKTKTEEELKAAGQDTFWIKYIGRDRRKNPWGWAVLRYKTDDSPPKPPLTLPQGQPVPLPANISRSWLEYELESLRPDSNFPTLAEVTRTIYITINQRTIDPVRGPDWFQNNLTWSEDAIGARPAFSPYLIQAYLQGTTPDYSSALINYGWDPITRAWPAKVGEVLDIVWMANSGTTRRFDHHPMHAHGEHYYDLGSGPGSYNAVENEKKFASYTPAKRDTTMLYQYVPVAQEDFKTIGWRAWRIRITEENVGAWMMHCHLLPHIARGMSTVWVYGNGDEIQKEIPEPFAHGYLEYGGSAYGNDTYDPLVVHYFDK